MYQKIDAYIHRLIQESTPDRTIWNIEKLREGKKGSWNYIDGCMMTTLLSMAEITGEREYFDFVEGFIDSYVLPDGTIRTYQPEKFNLDDINEGRVLLPLYRATGKEKYRLAAENLKRHLAGQPRTMEGNFWHKAIYPNQVWLDGIYMAQAFYALYQQAFGGGDYSDILHQIETVHERMYDGEKGLYYHGYDASRTAFWADPSPAAPRAFGCGASAGSLWRWQTCWRSSPGRTGRSWPPSLPSSWRASPGMPMRKPACTTRCPTRAAGRGTTWKPAAAP